MPRTKCYYCGDTAKAWIKGKQACAYCFKREKWQAKVKRQIAKLSIKRKPIKRYGITLN